MSWRSRLEDKHTVVCRSCGHAVVDTHKKPRQKYLKGKCPSCGKVGK